MGETSTFNQQNFSETPTVIFGRNRTSSYIYKWFITVINVTGRKGFRELQFTNTGLGKFLVSVPRDCNPHSDPYFIIIYIFFFYVLPENRSPDRLYLGVLISFRLGTYVYNFARSEHNPILLRSNWSIDIICQIWNCSYGRVAHIITLLSYNTLLLHMKLFWAIFITIYEFLAVLPPPPPFMIINNYCWTYFITPYKLLRQWLGDPTGKYRQTLFVTNFRRRLG